MCALDVETARLCSTGVPSMSRNELGCAGIAAFAEALSDFVPSLESLVYAYSANVLYQVRPWLRDYPQ